MPRDDSRVAGENPELTLWLWLGRSQAEVPGSAPQPHALCFAAAAAMFS